MSQQLANDRLYSSSFYDSYASRSHSSARKILSLVFDYVTPTSVADVGCGVGTWLAAAEELGCARLAGFDGTWVNRRDLLSEAIEFRPVNFEGEFAIQGRFDLCLSLEVAEHISEGQAETFIDQLCGASDVVLFSAAVPCQGGAHHVNEQPQSYWIQKFGTRSFECFDVIRSKVWDDPDVEFWYRQNCFLFVRTGSSAVDHERLHRDSAQGISDIVHPGFFAWKLSEFQDPDLRSVLRYFKKYARSKGRGLAATAGGVFSRIRRQTAGAPAGRPQTTTASQ